MKTGSLRCRRDLHWLNWSADRQLGLSGAFSACSLKARRPGQARLASADPGPITPGLALTRTRGYQLAPSRLPGVMGPGFRQDDDGDGAARPILDVIARFNRAIQYSRDRCD